MLLVSVYRGNRLFGGSLNVRLIQSLRWDCRRQGIPVVMFPVREICLYLFAVLTHTSHDGQAKIAATKHSFVKENSVERTTPLGYMLGLL